MLTDGYHDVPEGRLAAIVTSLQMVSRPLPAEEPPAPGVLHRLREPTAEAFRRLYREVGSDWLWFSRLLLSDAELTSIIRSPDVELHQLEGTGGGEGILELDFRVEGECELAFFGLSRPLIGRGAGRWLMNRALERAWARPIRRLWVHTCTLDHPDALAFYVRSGFTPYRRQVEVMPDPRLAGLLPRGAAAHVPILSPSPPEPSA
jgi:GNAT superfamily N-acetyltransferase